MLFDLKSGKRRRVVQVVFGFLAFIFFISFVGFGIGSDVTGGIFDAIGLGGGSSSNDPQYEEQIDDAEATLDTDPDNQKALLDLVRYHYLSATSSGVETDPTTGQTSISEEAHTELEQAAQAWTDYLKTDPKTTDLNTAANAAQVFVLLGDAEGAAGAQAIVAENGPKSAAAYGQLAFYYYAAGEMKKGDEAAKQAVAAAPASDADQIEKNLASLRKQAVKQQEAIKEQQEQGGAEAGEQQLQDPFGGLGGAGTTPPVTPTP